MLFSLNFLTKNLINITAVQIAAQAERIALTPVRADDAEAASGAVSLRERFFQIRSHRLQIIIAYIVIIEKPFYY